MMQLLRRLAAYGHPAHSGDAVLTWHAISNQIWLWNITLTAGMIPLIAILFAIFGDLLGAKRWISLASYSAIPLGIVVVQIFLFWWGNRPPSSPALLPQGEGSINSPSPSGRGGWGVRELALHLVIASDCVMLWLFSLLIGRDGGVHFLLPFVAVLPFYFFRSELHARAWLTKAAWTISILLQFAGAIILYSLPSPFGKGVGGECAWQPLPGVVTGVVGSVVVGLATFMAIIFAAYFWWQLGVSLKVRRIWTAVRSRGTHLFPDPLSVRDRIYQSTTIAVFILIVSGVMVFQLLLAWHVYLTTQDATQAIRLALVHAGTSLAGILLFSVCLYAQGKTKSDTPTILVYFTGTLYIFCIGMINSAGSFVYLASMIILPYPILIFYQKDKKVVAHALLSFIFFMAALNFYLLHRFPAILPFAEFYDLPIRICILITLVASNLINFIYMKSQTNISDAIIMNEKDKSESLLLNILPRDVAAELKLKGFSAPREYPSTTVIFTDFVGFTRIAESMTATELVRELDQCFSYFDNVAQKYGLEKLKTIGDAYMAAGGIPVENHTHPIDCALAALEIQAFMNQMKEIKEQQGLPYWELRLGMHTGPLVAGVVGEKKFAYDVWGDTVNLASRMESSGVPGAINISREFYDRVKYLFVCEFRGKIYAKNKGEIEMYFLRGIKPKFCLDAPSLSGTGVALAAVRAGRVPNADFKEIYQAIKNGARLAPAKIAQPGDKVYG